MLQALQFNPLLIKYAGPDLKNDFDLCLIAFSDRDGAQDEWRRRFFDCGRIDHVDNVQQIEQFRVDVEAKLELYDVFSSVVLPAISLEKNGSDCTLALLNQGSTTSIAHKKLIAEYMGVPTGKTLQQFRMASENLELFEDFESYSDQYESGDE